MKRLVELICLCALAAVTHERAAIGLAASSHRGIAEFARGCAAYERRFHQSCR